MLGLCAAFRPAWPVAAIYGVLLVGGFFRSLQFTAYNTLAYGDVPRSRMSAATSLYTTGQQLAATIGVSAGALALEVAMRLSGSEQCDAGGFLAWRSWWWRCCRWPRRRWRC